MTCRHKLLRWTRNTEYEKRTTEKNRNYNSVSFTIENTNAKESIQTQNTKDIPTNFWGRQKIQISWHYNVDSLTAKEINDTKSTHKWNTRTTLPLFTENTTAIGFLLYDWVEGTMPAWGILKCFSRRGWETERESEARYEWLNLWMKINTQIKKYI